MPFFYPTADNNLIGKHLVVPIVSTANLPQLCVDLLITSLSLRRVGIFDSQYLIPVVGGREDGEEGLTTPLELYGREGLDILVIQQRSPVLKSFKQNFVDSLLNFIRDEGFASVLFLSGISPINRTDDQRVLTYYIYPRNTPSLKSTPLAQINNFMIPPYTSPSIHDFSDRLIESAIPVISGGGLTRRILLSFPDNWPVPTMSLVHFVMEGDNRVDASTFAGIVANLLGLKIGEWKYPASWQYGLFGPLPDLSLYN